MAAAKTKDTRTRVVDVICGVIGCDPAEVKDTSSLIDLGADSLDVVEVAIGLEEAFSLEEVGDNEMTGDSTCGQLVKLAEAKCRKS